MPRTKKVPVKFLPKEGGTITFHDITLDHFTFWSRAQHISKPYLEALKLLNEGKTYKEIGDAVSVPPGTVRSRLHRARLRIFEIKEGRRATAGEE